MENFYFSEPYFCMKKKTIEIVLEFRLLIILKKVNFKDV